MLRNYLISFAIIGLILGLIHLAEKYFKTPAPQPAIATPLPPAQ